MSSSRRKQQTPLRVKELLSNHAMLELSTKEASMASTVADCKATNTIFESARLQSNHFETSSVLTKSCAEQQQPLLNSKEMELNEADMDESEDFTDGNSGFDVLKQGGVVTLNAVLNGQQLQKCSLKKELNGRRGAMKIPPVMLETGEEVYYCPLCEEQEQPHIMRTPSDLTEHLRSHNKPPLNGEGHKCALCSETLSSQSSLDRHMLTHSNERPYVCCVCNADFTTNGNTRRHLEVHERTETNPEILSLIRDQLRGDKRRKRKREEQMSTYGCPPSQCDTPISSSIAVHRNSPTTLTLDSQLSLPSSSLAMNYRPFDLSGTQLGVSTSLMTYNPMLVAAAVNGATIPTLMTPASSVPASPACRSIPLESSRTKSPAKSNSATCFNDNICDITDEKSFQRELRGCALCDSIFEKVSDLTVHINKIHCGRQPYQCRACNAETFDKSTIRRHVLIHIDGPAGNPYVCILCEERRESRVEGMSEQARRSKQKNNKMEIDENEVLAVDGTAEEACTEEFNKGQWRFTTKANARRHFDSKHADEPALRANRSANACIRFEPPPEAVVQNLINSPDAVCNGCGQDLKFFRDLHRHLHTHPTCQQAAPSFTCQKCAQGYRTYESFIAHVRLHHPELPLSLSRDGLVRVGFDPRSSQQNQNVSLLSQQTTTEVSSPIDDVIEEEASIGCFNGPPQHTSSPVDFLPLDLSKPKKRYERRMSEGDSGALDLSPKDSHGGSTPDRSEQLITVTPPQMFYRHSDVSEPQPILTTFANNFGMPFNQNLNSAQLAAACFISQQRAALLASPASTSYNYFPPQYAPLTNANPYNMFLAANNWPQASISLPLLPPTPQSQLTTAGTNETKERLRQKIHDKHAIFNCDVPSKDDTNAALSYSQFKAQKKVSLQKPLLNSMLVPAFGFDALLESNQRCQSSNNNGSMCTSEDETTHLLEQDTVGVSCVTSNPNNEFLRNMPKKKNSYKDAPNKIACPESGCSHYFPWMSSLKRHIITHTDKKPFHCTRCQHAFSTKSNRERHMERIHGVSKTGEDLTEYEKKQLDLHDRVAEAMGAELLKQYGTLYTTVNPERGSPRNRSASFFYTSSSLSTNVSTNSGASISSLSSAPSPLESKSGLAILTSNSSLASTSPLTSVNTFPVNANESNEDHVVTKAAEFFECTQCGAQFECWKALKRHSRYHLQDALFKCHVCVETQATRRGMLEHLEAKHSAEWQMLCEKFFLDNVDQFLAAAMHTIPSLADNNLIAAENNLSAEDSTEDARTDKKIHCAVCPRRFWSHQDLQRHMRSHTGARPYGCETCGRKFTLKHSLQRHQKTHMSEQSAPNLHSHSLDLESADIETSNDSSSPLWQPYLAEPIEKLLDAKSISSLEKNSQFGNIAFPGMDHEDDQH